jgi:hypothetical protein
VCTRRYEIFYILTLQEAINQFKENMLYEMISIEENKGKVPTIFVHTIED